MNTKLNHFSGALVQSKEKWFNIFSLRSLTISQNLLNLVPGNLESSLHEF